MEWFFEDYKHIYQMFGSGMLDLKERKHDHRSSSAPYRVFCPTRSQSVIHIGGEN